MLNLKFYVTFSTLGRIVIYYLSGSSLVDTCLVHGKLVDYSKLMCNFNKPEHK